MPTCQLAGCTRECCIENGFTYPFCGRTHAIEAGHNNPLPGSQRKCALNGCDQLVKVDEATRRVFDYCSLAHRDMAKKVGEYPMCNTSAKACQLPGCSRRKYVFPNGSEMDFCGKTHADEFKNRNNNSNNVSAVTIKLGTLSVGAHGGSQGDHNNEDKEDNEDNEDNEEDSEDEEEDDNGALAEMRERIRDEEEKERGTLFCKACDNVLCPLSWLSTYVFEESGRRTTACVLVAGHQWNEMEVKQLPHHTPTRNKPFKYHCSECNHSVGAHWRDSHYDGPMLKCDDVGLRLPTGTELNVTSWRACPEQYLPRREQVVSNSAAFAVRPLAPEEERFASIKDQFDNSWRATREDKYRYHKQWVRAKLTSVVEIVNQKIYGRLLNYQQQLPRKSRVKRCFHGTSRSAACRLHAGRVCQNTSLCALCSICVGGFDMRRAGQQRRWERFGNGIYFGPTAAKSHDYNGDTKETEGSRAMLMCLVETGKELRLTEDAPDMTKPPAGFDSVYGAKQTHREHEETALRFAERVVYTERATAVNYVLFYKFTTHQSPPPRRTGGKKK